MDFMILFRDSMQSVLGPLDWLPIPDGDIHRFHVPGDKPGTLNGWYVLFLDGIPCGMFGSWKAGGSQVWRSGKTTDHLEAQVIARRIEQARRQRAAKQHQGQQAAAEHANRIWRNARSADPEHPYLVAKGVRSYALRQAGDVLLVPLMRDGVLVSLQRIKPDGNKRFLFGGMTKGCCSLIGTIQPDRALYICEGWATAATLHAETGAAVACAMTASNLLEVGQRLQRQHPDAVLIIAGDDDRMTEGNPGRTYAIKAASALGCRMIFPPWSGAEPLTLSDFNDLANWSAAQ
ncbi:toprim domain-containing protein [Pseudomonas laurylsulfatiphila]|uniref:toprim domain-containing protein n=1 Tax=Pseudomonas laurylsulfatiphila TaxID=2011015 RepID=UPI0021609B8F|nr:toprim domain-containing protein [Pseudomonas laurylsulfatiphila]UVM07126.1 toprim domain-containing protein [Pseudomonas laurylsulfatiphila]